MRLRYFMATGLLLLGVGRGWAQDQIYQVAGVIQSLRPTEALVVIRHDSIPGYMPAMTMPFHVRDQQQLAGWQPGAAVDFELHVTASNSWVANLRRRSGTPFAPAEPVPTAPVPSATAPSAAAITFTNELGEPVHLSDFRGQVVALTFIYTRCPLPDYCPRLSKNFSLAAQALAARTNLPANWHFLSVTLDPEFDSPAQLQAYARSYQYDPRHWHFLTGSPPALAAFAQKAGIESTPDGAGFNHNFRTLIIDGNGQVQTVFPTSGDLSSAITKAMSDLLAPPPASPPAAPPDAAR